MKAVVRCLAVLSFAVIISSVAHAQCGVNATCITSWTVPGTLIGDGTSAVVATATAQLAQNATSWLLELQNAQVNGIKWHCLNGLDSPAGGGVGFNGGCNVSGDTAIVELFTAGQVTTQTTVNLQARAGYQGTYDPGMSAPLTLLPIQNPNEPGPNEPDLPCPCGNAGQPINVTNGNTWIAQQDYFIPGLAGGLKLTRTWNSLWTLTNPPETSGIFGHSWRSNFEERIQVLTGGVVKYWKGNGSSLFFTYNGLTGAYALTAPADDQTSLGYDSISSQWTITEKSGTQHFFNNAGYLTSIMDRNGNAITITIDAANQNRISSVTDASGRILNFNYANASYPRLCTSISDAVGTVTTYGYDFATGRLTNVTYFDGSQYNFQYTDPNSNTLISLVTDSLGKTVEAHTYDSSRRGKTSQQANDSNGSPVNKITVWYSFQGVPWRNYVADSVGGGTYVTIANKAQRHYIGSTSGTGRACATCEFPGSSSRTINDSGYDISYSDAAGNRIMYNFDSQGNLVGKSLPEGNAFGGNGYDTWSYTYNSFGQVLTATDPLATQLGDPNHTTTYNYDSHGNLLSVTTPSPDGGTTPGSATSFTYNSNGTVATITDPLNHTTTINYCPSGQSNCPQWMVQSITDSNNKTTNYTYDARGNRLIIQDPVNGSANPTAFTYDSMNRVTSITYPGATSSVQFHYDYRGRRDWVQDQNGNRNTYAYDDADRLISVTDAQSPTPGVTRYAYDTENNLTDVWDAAGNHTHFGPYDGQRPMKVTFPSGYYENYGWDGDYNLVSKTDRNGNQINYYPDHQNRLSVVGYPNGRSISYTYDPAGRLTQVSDPYSVGTGTYTFSYDNMARLTSATTNYVFTSFGNKTVQYAYDAASNRTSMTDPQNAPTSYGYDNLNRLTSLVYNNQTPGFTFGYDDLSRRTSLTRPNGVNTSYGYNPASHLLSVLHQLGSTVIDGATYTYDQAGNRLTRTDQRTGTSLTYGYDNVYQLLSATQGTTTTESYTYDLVGNRLSSLGMSPYTYNSSNELTSIPSGSYTYDKNGNTTVKPDGTQYTWDYENRLTKAVLPGSGGTVNFKYDPFGRRIQKALTRGSITTTTNYLYDSLNLLEELDSSSNVLARYTQGPGIDQPLSELRSGTTSYYEADGLGSVSSLSNGAGTLANTYSYDSFGKLLFSSGTVTNPFQYTGREFDSESGLLYYRARYYDASTGRFLSEDPAWKSLNAYLYAANDPTNNFDPTGLETLPTDPSGLPPSWVPDRNHKDPQSERYCRPNGDCLDFTRGRPGEPGWEGRDHWHWNPFDPNKGKCVKDKEIGDRGHLEPGDEIPDAPAESPVSEMADWVWGHRVAIGVGVGIGVGIGVAVVCPECLAPLAPLVPRLVPQLVH